MYQKLIIVGNLGSDPEMRFTASGTAVTSFSVATSRKWGGDNPGEETTWFKVSAWGKQAESCNQYLSKGSKVLVEGRLSQDKGVGGPRIWTDNKGDARANFEVRALTVTFLSGRNDRQADTGNQKTQVSENKPPAHYDLAEDEIPF